MNNTLKLIISIAFPLAAGLTGGLFTASQIPGWYVHLQKPSWNPPNWLFAPVWTVLYIMMGIALFLVWKNNADRKVKRTAITIFVVQMLLNFMWSFIFFNRHQVGYALADIVLLWMLIIATIYWFGKISTPAAWLLVPYLCWVTFAAALNFAIWKLN